MEQILELKMDVGSSGYSLDIQGVYKNLEGDGLLAFYRLEEPNGIALTVISEVACKTKVEVERQLPVQNYIISNQKWQSKNNNYIVISEDDMKEKLINCSQLSHVSCENKTDIKRYYKTPNDQTDDCYTDGLKDAKVRQPGFPYKTLAIFGAFAVAGLAAVKLAHDFIPEVKPTLKK